MVSIFAETRKIRTQRKNTCLYILNTIMVIGISSMVFAFAMPASVGFIVLLLDNGRITQWAKLIPEWLQFIEIKEVKILSQMTPEINFLFYASLFLAIAITAITVCMLCQMQKNSEKRGENKCQLEILGSLDQEKKQTITYLGSHGSGENKEIYVALEKKYSNGCIIKKGDKIAMLKYNVSGNEHNLPGSKKNSEYIVEYKDIENFKEDFFGKKNSTEVTIYGFKPHATVLSTLSGVIFKTHPREEKIESPPLS